MVLASALALPRSSTDVDAGPRAGGGVGDTSRRRECQSDGLLPLSRQMANGAAYKHTAR